MRVLIRILVVLGALFVALLLAVVLLLVIGFRVPLDSLREPMEHAASQALGRAVVIEGGIELVPAFAPTFQIEGVRVADSPPSPEGDFLRVDLARLQMRALPLLLARIHIAELAAEGIVLDLRRDRRGAVNWAFEGAEASAADSSPQESHQESPQEEDAGGFDLVAFLEEFTHVVQIVGLDELRLRGIAVHYRDQLLDREFDIALEECSGVLLAHEPLRLVATGSLQGEKYRMNLEGDAPTDLADEDEPWRMELRVELARTVLELAGHVEGNPLEASFWSLDQALDGAIVARLSLKGDRVSDLAPVFGAALPPLGPYRVSGTVDSRGIRISIPDLVIGVGGSELRGELWGDYVDGVQPRVEVKLAVDALQLNDFDFGEWSPFEASPEASPEVSPEAEESVAEPIEIPSLLSAQVMGRLDARLRVDVNSVQSGPERLGGAHLEAQLEQGRLELSSLQIEVPGGAFDLSAAYEPTQSGIESEIRARIDQLDYGVLARRVDPETDMSGEISLDVGLRSSSPSVEAVMANASGYFDFALWPENFESGIFDLWAVNLMSAVLPAVEGGKKSEIHCIVGLFDLQDGLMEQKGFAIDTTRMRVSGEAVVDFREETVKMELVPEPKKPEFFSAATPIQVEGSFSDFDVGVRPEDLVGTVLRFVTSVVVVPLQRLIQSGKLGTEEACAQALEAADRPKSF
ncbi:MAG: AsmA family protein [Deltaproteobacteria bacterium]|nr:AsmA family protein [Deltaproteobacteria bacterium]MBW2419156.1 AsmA family protein [Deltaproteobacteria bacterium]